MNVPKLRFKEFTDEWIKIDLSTCFEYFSTNSLSREQLSDYGIIKNIHYGDIHKKYGNVVDVENDVAIYIKDAEQNNKYEFCCENDIIFADASEDYDGIGKAIELINVNEKLVSGLHTIHARDKKQFFSPLFKGYYFNTPIIHNQIRILANGFKVFGISKDNINNLKVMLPSKQEQEKIAKLLSLLDKKIQLQTKKIEALKLFKKGLFDIQLKINGKESIMFDDFLDEVTKKSSIQNQYPVLSSTSKGLFLQSDYFNKQASCENNVGYKILKRNQLVLSPQNLWMGNININNIFDIGIVSPSYRVYNIDIKKMDLNYFNYWIKTPKALYSYLISSEQGASIVRRNLNIEMFNQISLKIPNLEKQHIIGNRIYQFDLKINLEEEKLKLLYKLKKGLMQKMFI